MKKLKMLIATLWMTCFVFIANAQNWSLTGNSGTNTSANFIGTTDAKSFKVRTNNSVRMFISSSGNVGIGTTSPSTKLQVNGNITANGTVTGSAAFTGISGSASPGDSIGYGVYGNALGILSGASAKLYGVYGYAGDAPLPGSGGTKYGVYGIAHNGAPYAPAYGVYGDADGISDYWAGYFAGKTHVASLHVGTEKDVTGYKVIVNGKILCEELKVQNSINWPDYVFKKDHKLPTLDEVEQNININGHLQGMPGACEAEEQGINIGEMQKQLLEKIEELTLYVIQQNKRVETLEKDNAHLKALIEK